MDTTNLRVSVEQAALNALGAWLRSRLPAYSYNHTTKQDAGILIQDQWPEPDQRLPSRGVTLVRAGDATDVPTQATVCGTDIIHDGKTATIRIAVIQDLLTNKRLIVD